MRRMGVLGGEGAVVPKSGAVTSKDARDGADIATPAGKAASSKASAARSIFTRRSAFTATVAVSWPCGTSRQQSSVFPGRLQLDMSSLQQAMEAVSLGLQ